MPVMLRQLTPEQQEAPLAIEETHFIDLKGTEITPANLTIDPARVIHEVA